MYESMALLAGFVLIYSAVAGGVEKTSVSGPIVFVVFGLLIGPLGFGLLTMEADSEMLSTLAELTLALVLFTDASGVDLKMLRRADQLPVRLLFIGLPLTILLGFGLGLVVFTTFTVFEVAVLATMLAPTDAALGKAVVSNEAVPPKIRQGLNIESGLNDGICVPFLYLFLALGLGQVGADGPLAMGFGLILEVIGIGLITGLAVTIGSAYLFRYADKKGWVTPTWEKMSILAIAFTSFGISQALGGSGFIACFVGGITFGGLVGPAREKLLDAAEGTGDTFALLTWVIFGAFVVGQGLPQITWQVAVYAVLSLTVIRMLPVFLVLAGLKQSTEAKLFMGWFGPRGLASIVFAVIVINAGLPHGDVIATTTVYTIVLSIILHGVTANPWARAFGERAKQAAKS